MGKKGRGRYKSPCPEVMSLKETSGWTMRSRRRGSLQEKKKENKGGRGRKEEEKRYKSVPGQKSCH
jgi:hypothetical protein